MGRIRQRHGDDVLHHTLVLRVEDVAVQDVLTDVAPVSGAEDHHIRSEVAVRPAHTLDPNGILPNALEPRVIGVRRASIVIDGVRRTYVFSVGIEDRDNLKRIHMNVERVAEDLRV